MTWESYLLSSIGVLLSGLSLVAVVIIGSKTLRLGQRSTEASERSAQASVEAAAATHRSVEASERAAIASEEAAHATERSVFASERAAVLAAQDARVRRLEAVMDVLLQMRALFNEQHSLNPADWVPGINSPEALARLALQRALEARLVPFEDDLPLGVNVRTVPTTWLWSSTLLEQAIAEIKELMKAATSYSVR